MEPESSLPCSQELATGLCPQPKSNPHHLSLRAILMLPFHLHLCLLPSCFMMKIFYASHIPMHVIYPTHLILLDLITLIIFSEAPHYAFSPGSCNFLSLWSKYYSQHFILKYPQSVLALG
jgi:hypothetical protein